MTEKELADIQAAIAAAIALSQAGKFNDSGKNRG